MYHDTQTGLARIVPSNRQHPLSAAVESLLVRLQNVAWMGREGKARHPVRAHRLGHEDFGLDLEESDAEADVLAAIRERAGELHETLVHEHGVFAVEFVGSTGGGKTRLIEQLLERAAADERIGAVVGDVAGEDDATRLREYGIPVENINTGKECHLDPEGVGTALAGFDLETLDTLYVENVGNMVCPADFPLGASLRILVVSTTEGDDVVSKHPLLVQAADAAVINKIDLAEAVGTDLDRVRRDIKRTAPELPVFETNAREGDGMNDLAAFLRSHRQTQEANVHAHGTERSIPDRLPHSHTGGVEDGE